MSLQETRPCFRRDTRTNVAFGAILRIPWPPEKRQVWPTPDIRQAGQFVKEIRVVLISAFEPAPRQALAQRRLVPPPSFPQALEHVSVVFSPHPRHALVDIQIERGRRNREGLFQRLPRFLDPTGLA